MIIKEYEDRAKALVENLKKLEYDDQCNDPEEAEFYTHPDLESLMRFTHIISNNNPTATGMMQDIVSPQELNVVIQEMIEQLQHASIMELGKHIYGDDYEERLNEYLGS